MCDKILLILCLILCCNQAVFAQEVNRKSQVNSIFKAQAYMAVEMSNNNTYTNYIKENFNDAIKVPIGLFHSYIGISIDDSKYSVEFMGGKSVYSTEGSTNNYKLTTSTAVFNMGYRIPVKRLKAEIRPLLGFSPVRVTVEAENKLTTSVYQIFKSSKDFLQLSFGCEYVIDVANISFLGVRICYYQPLPIFEGSWTRSPVINSNNNYKGSLVIGLVFGIKGNLIPIRD